MDDQLPVWVDLGADEGEFGLHVHALEERRGLLGGGGHAISGSDGRTGAVATVGDVVADEREDFGSEARSHVGPISINISQP